MSPWSNALTTNTSLTRAAELARDGPGDGCRQVRILKHNQRCVSGIISACSYNIQQAPYASFDGPTPLWMQSNPAMQITHPPNSLVIFFIVPAQFAASIFPTRVLPVNETFRTSGLVVSSFPISWRFFSQVTTFRTPSGTPARRASCHLASIQTYRAYCSPP